VKHGIIASDLNVGVILSANRLTVISEDRRLSLILLSSLREFYAYYLKNAIVESFGFNLGRDEGEIN